MKRHTDNLKAMTSLMDSASSHHLSKYQSQPMHFDGAASAPVLLGKGLSRSKSIKFVKGKPLQSLNPKPRKTMQPSASAPILLSKTYDKKRDPLENAESAMPKSTQKAELPLNLHGMVYSADKGYQAVLGENKEINMSITSTLNHHPKRDVSTAPSGPTLGFDAQLKYNVLNTRLKQNLTVPEFSRKNTVPSYLRYDPNNRRPKSVVQMPKRKTFKSLWNRKIVNEEPWRKAFRYPHGNASNSKADWKGKVAMAKFKVESEPQYYDHHELKAARLLLKRTGSLPANMILGMSSEKSRRNEMKIEAGRARYSIFGGKYGTGPAVHQFRDDNPPADKPRMNVIYGEMSSKQEFEFRMKALKDDDRSGDCTAQYTRDGVTAHRRWARKHNKNPYDLSCCSFTMNNRYTIAGGVPHPIMDPIPKEERPRPSGAAAR